MSTMLAGVLIGAGVPGLFNSLVAYSLTMAVLSMAAFGGLIYTLVAIRCNLAALNELTDTWPPVKEVNNDPFNHLQRKI